MKDVDETTNNGQQAVALKERAGSLVAEKVRAAAHVIVHEALRSALFPKVLHWIGPEEITHKTRCRWLAEPIQIPNVIESVEFGRKPPMDPEELLVHDGSEGKGAERVHTGITQAFGVLSLTLKLEIEVLSQVSGFMIASQKVECIGIPDLNAEVPSINITS